MTPFAWFCLGMPAGALFVLLCVVLANGIPKYQRGGMVDGSDGIPAALRQGLTEYTERVGDVSITHVYGHQPPKAAPPPKTGTG